MGRLINTTAMTVDGVIDVSDWYVVEGGHDGASLALFADDAAMLLGRKTFEGLAAFWPTQSGRWAGQMNAIPKYVASRSRLGALEWNATAIEGNAIEGVRRLKAEHYDDFVMSGCGGADPGWSRGRASVLGASPDPGRRHPPVPGGPRCR